MTRQEARIKLFGWLYYPLQYLVIHLILFQFNEMNIVTVYKGFRITDIVRAVAGFINLIPEVITAETVLMLIISAIPFILRLLWACKWIIFYGFGCLQVFTWLWGQYMYIRHLRYISLDKVMIVEMGSPGSGKSSSGGFRAVQMAKLMWRMLQEKHRLYRSQVDKWQLEGNIQKLLEWAEIEESYNYYMNNYCIPCLFSNIPIEVDGQRPSRLTVDHLYQKKRLPSYTVLFVDEIGAMVSVDASKGEKDEYGNKIGRPYEVSDFSRLQRHFGDFRMIATEQDCENIYIDIRRVVAVNQYLIRQRWVLRPLPLLFIYNLLRSAYSLLNRFDRLFVPILRTMNSYIRGVGFRKYYYYNQGNTEQSGILDDNKIRAFYLPPQLNFKYDDRTFREFYECKGMELEIDIFDSLVIPGDAESKRAFLRKRDREPEYGDYDDYDYRGR